MFEAVHAILSEVAEGRAVQVSMVGGKAELSTTEAASELGMSRPTLINLLEAGEMEYRFVGSHRRIPRAEVEAYRRRSAEVRQKSDLVRRRREAALQEMARITHAAGEGY